MYMGAMGRTLVRQGCCLDGYLTEIGYGQAIGCFLGFFTVQVCLFPEGEALCGFESWDLGLFPGSGL
jgi:hypothetical protein